MKFDKDGYSTINPQDSQELKDLKKDYNDSLTQRKLMDRQGLAIETMKFFSEIYLTTNDPIYLRRMISEINLALKTISEILLMKTNLNVKESEDNLLDLAKELGDLKKKLQADLDKSANAVSKTVEV